MIYRGNLMSSDSTSFDYFGVCRTFLPGQEIIYRPNENRTHNRCDYRQTSWATAPWQPLCSYLIYFDIFLFELRISMADRDEAPSKINAIRPSIDNNLTAISTNRGLLWRGPHTEQRRRRRCHVEYLLYSS